MDIHACFHRRMTRLTKQAALKSNCDGKCECDRNREARAGLRSQDWLPHFGAGGSGLAGLETEPEDGAGEDADGAGDLGVGQAPEDARVEADKFDEEASDAGEDQVSGEHLAGLILRRRGGARRGAFVGCV